MKKLLIIFMALVLTGAPFVAASDVKLRFSGHGSPEYVLISEVEGKPIRFRFSKCGDRFGRRCTRFGKREGYSLEEIRTPYMHLDDLRMERGLTKTEARTYETLALLIDGIERPPYRRNPSPVYSWTIKGSVGQFIRVVEARL